MRWSPYIAGQWIARVPADHAWRTITRADEIKRNDEMSMEKWWNEICGRGNERNPAKNLPKPRFVHHETHMEWPRRELGTPAVGGERLTALRHEAAIEKNNHYNFEIQGVSKKLGEWCLIWTATSRMCARMRMVLQRHGKNRQTAWTACDLQCQPTAASCT